MKSGGRTWDQRGLWSQLMNSLMYHVKEFQLLSYRPWQSNFCMWQTVCTVSPSEGTAWDTCFLLFKLSTLFDHRIHFPQSIYEFAERVLPAQFGDCCKKPDWCFSYPPPGLLCHCPWPGTEPKGACMCLRGRACTPWVQEKAVPWNKGHWHLWFIEQDFSFLSPWKVGMVINTSSSTCMQLDKQCQGE